MIEQGDNSSTGLLNRGSVGIVTSSSAAVILLEVGLDRMLAVRGCTGVF